MLNVTKELPANTDTEMGPIATGLGEIYHYTIRAKEGYEDKYTLTQLRTMQDWIVRKQLSGTPGVAEVTAARPCSKTLPCLPVVSLSARRRD